MNKTNTVLSALVVIAVLAFAQQCFSAQQWETRAKQALTWVQDDAAVIDSLKRVAAATADSAQHTDTLRITTIRTIAAVDSASHPDSTCKPSLAVRDKALEQANTEIGQWKRAYFGQVLVGARLATERDSLRNVLLARPKSGITLALLHPEITVSAVYMVWPDQRFGIAISVPLAKIKL